MFLWFSFLMVEAQELTQGRVLNYSSKNGLSLGIVNSILQDNQGQVWFATSDGLNRFNGTSFQVFRHTPSDGSSIAGNYIKSIFKDRQGTLWISSRNGLSEFVENQQNFKRYQPPTEKGDQWRDISDIAQASNGDLWLSLNGSGFAAFDTRTHQFTNYNQKNLKGLSTNSILSVFEDSRGLLWLGSRDTGIEAFRIDAQRRFTKVSLDDTNVPDTRIHRIFEDHNHDIWLATAKGLILYKRKESRFYPLHLPESAGSDIFLSLAETRQHQLLVGVQEGGLYRIDLSRPLHPESLKLELVKAADNTPVTQRSVQSLFIDADQNVWIGTYGEGVYLMGHEAEKFTLHSQRAGKTKGLIRFYGMCQDQAGNLWLGTDGDGIYKSRPNGELIKHYAPSDRPGSLKDGAVITAYRDRQQTLWFGTYSKGLFRYNPQTDSFQQFAHQAGDPSSLSKNDVRVIYQDRKQRLWIGTNGGGLSQLDQKTGKFQHYLPSNSTINSNDVRAIVEDEKGNLWIGTYGGSLNYFDVSTQRFTSLFNDPGDPHFISNHIVISLALDASGRLWIGTEGNGLLIYDTRSRRAEWFNESNGLPNHVINSIQLESTDYVWLSTNNGLSRISQKDRSIVSFDQQNNLQSGQFNPGSSLYDAQHDFMAFGGTEGWNFFRPSRIKPSSYHPKVMISGLQVFDKHGGKGSTAVDEILFQPEKTLSLDPSQPVFTIQFTSLNYAYPENSRFAYQLEGLDKDWYYTDQERSVTYRYLPPGNYVFKVKAANQDGVWFEDYVSLPLQILPPWYQSAWAYVLYIMGAVLALYAYQRYRFRQARLAYEVQLAQMEARKEKELHEKRLSFFTHISHECRTPLTLIINPVRELLSAQKIGKEHSNLTLIYRNARRLLSMMDQLLLFQKAEQETDSLKLASVNLYEMGHEVFQCFLHQAETQHVQYTFTCENENLELSCDREKLEIALFNLISNALKFTPSGGVVQVIIEEHASEVMLKVEDSGVGIAQQNGSDIFQLFHQQKSGKAGFGIGLYLTKNYVEKHGGTIRYESEMGKGTAFTIAIQKTENALGSGVPLNQPSVFLEELSGAVNLEWLPPSQTPAKGMMSELAQEKDTLLIADDEEDIRAYLRQLLEDQYRIIECASGEEALEAAHQYQPDLVISDVMMSGISGLELCQKLKAEASLSHIPVILLTASSRQEIELQSMEERADAFFRKPFDPALLMVQIGSILKNRKDLRSYFYNEITLQSSSFKVSPEYKEFLQDCIQIVERHLMDPSFHTKVLAAEIGLSQSTLYNRIKSISGKSINEFIRFIRLRKAAQVLLSTDITIAEAAYQVGMNDAKYFREQFYKLFGMNPSEYVKKYRKTFHENQSLGQQFFRG